MPGDAQLRAMYSDVVAKVDKAIKTKASKGSESV